MNSIQDELQQFLQKLRQQNAAGQPPTPEPVWEDIPEEGLTNESDPGSLE